MLARFFIDRPVLAWVISIVIVLLGGIAAGLLPIAQYPDITPPTVRVEATYPGANASLFYTSSVSALAEAWGWWASGPKSCQQRAMSCIRCRPSQSVCGPGSSSRFRFM